jgi:hypothetical protein
MYNFSSNLSLNDLISASSGELLVDSNMIAYPYYWQEPVATERFTYVCFSEENNIEFEYIAFPWATLIDSLKSSIKYLDDIFHAVDSIITRKPKTSRRVTVSQHILTSEFIDLFHACHISDIFWPHLTFDCQNIAGIRLHPFPLFPAQTFSMGEMPNINPSYKFLANFVGAYNKCIYITDTRKHIFNDIGKFSDIMIIKREGWHFDRAVYKEQILGINPDKDALENENFNRNTYLDIIRSSWFTLCPTGAGPNSIRIFESLFLRSIPIILTRQLRLPGDGDLWEKSAIIEEDSEYGYKSAIAKAREMKIEDRIRMIENGKRLYSLVQPSQYSNFVNHFLSV